MGEDGNANETPSTHGPLAMRKEHKPTPTNMKYQFDNPPTREAMILEFGADPARFHAAQEAIRSCASRATANNGGEEYYSETAVARVLMDCGLVDAFALYCVRHGAGRCRIAILPAWDGLPPCGGLLTIQAEFHESGALKIMEGSLDEGEPFGMGLNAKFGAVPLHVLKDSEWREACWKVIRFYEGVRDAERSYPWQDLVTVVRFPLSPTMAFRKFIEDRWYDPGVPQSERLACPLDRVAWEDFQRMRNTVADRFQQILDKVDGD